MKRHFAILLLFFTTFAHAKNRFSTGEISINGFRAPSIGLEFRYGLVSVHAGYYLTAFSGVTTNFIKTGFTAWFLPVGKRQILRVFMPALPLCAV